MDHYQPWINHVYYFEHISPAAGQGRDNQTYNSPFVRDSQGQNPDQHAEHYVGYQHDKAWGPEVDQIAIYPQLSARTQHQARAGNQQSPGETLQVPVSPHVSPTRHENVVAHSFSRTSLMAALYPSIPQSAPPTSLQRRRKRSRTVETGLSTSGSRVIERPRLYKLGSTALDNAYISEQPGMPMKPGLPMAHHHHLPDPGTGTMNMRVYSPEQSSNSLVGQEGMPSPAPRPSGLKPKFTSEDDQLLIQLKRHKNLTWKQIADFFPGRSSGTLQVRYCTKLKIKATLWTETKDYKLQRALREYENEKWCIVAQRVGPEFTPAACRERATQLELGDVEVQEQSEYSTSRQGSFVCPTDATHFTSDTKSHLAPSN